MPWLSRKQQAWGHTPEGEKALGGPEAVREWDSATDFSHLPERSMVTHEVTGRGGKSFKVKEGSLHRMLHIPQDEKIGEARMEKAEHSRNPTLRRKAISGLGLSHMHHG